MSRKAYHIPLQDPCTKCGLPASQHKKIEHAPEGNPCIKCGLPASNHRKRNRTRVEIKKLIETYKRIDTRRNRKRVDTRPNRHENRIIEYIGIDGEGQDSTANRTDHRYVLLAASNETGTKKWHVKSNRLSTIECLDLILRLPSKRTKIFSFAFNYDLTKILTDLDNESLYLLFRPELRQRTGPDAKLGPAPVKWKGYSLNLQGTKFSVRRRSKRVVIWDLFKFFQAKFVNALKDWQVGNKIMLEQMALMKDKRSEFNKESEQAVFNYCLEECRCIAELARKLIESHQKVNLKLKTFYGAGSSGGAMLTAMGVKDKIRPTIERMVIPVAQAFSGGRFENSIIGQVDGTVYNYDISSAYPYHITFLPCLVHGKWRLTQERRELESVTAALVHYGLGNSKIGTWGPFPFRTEDGTISFPITSGGGWVWREEYLAAERIFPHVQFKEAWVYETACTCEPFKKIPEYYKLRLQIGKEGPGIVIKLGCNSCYGKLAQSVGNAQFNSWIWAGMITSGCRAQVLDILALHRERSNLLAVATDGIYTREKIITPTPRDTGTFDACDIDSGKPKPLGAWEEKQYNRGMFFARPGIYFPLNPTDKDIKDIRGRGVGKGVVLENWAKIIDVWKKDGIDAIADIANVSRFCGAKTCISVNSKWVYRRANAKNGKLPAYGQWISRKVEMSFHPLPKREKVNPDGLTLKLRRFPRDLESVPYDRAVICGEAAELMMAQAEADEQPDGDFSFE